MLGAPVICNWRVSVLVFLLVVIMVAEHYGVFGCGWLLVCCCCFFGVYVKQYLVASISQVRKQVFVNSHLVSVLKQKSGGG